MRVRQETAGSTSLSNTISNQYPLSDKGALDSDSNQLTMTPCFRSKRDAEGYLDQTLFTLENIQIVGDDNP